MDKSKDRFQQLIESLPQLVWTCRADGLCDYLSPQWVKYTGIPESEQQEMGWLNQLHPDDRKRTIAVWNAAVGTGSFFDVEFRIRRSDGVYRWFSTRAIPLRDKEGRVTQWYGSNTDIEDRKRTEEALLLAQQELEQRVAQRTAELHKREQYLFTTLQSIGDAVITTGTDGRIEMMNPVAEALTGWSRTDAHGKPLEQVFRIFNEETHVVVENPGQRVLREGVVVGLANHTILIARDGVERPIADSAAPIRDEGGAVTGIVMVFRDQTAERAALRAQQESEERFRLLVEGVKDYAIFMLDPGGHVVSWNAGAERLTGYRAGEITGRHFSCFYRKEDVAGGRPEQALVAAAAEGRVEDEGWRVCKDGSQYLANVVITALHDDAGHLHGFANISRDITERKCLVEKLQRKTDFQQLLMNMAAAYINLPVSAIDQMINHSMKDLATFVGADRAWIFRYDFGKQIFSNTHEWCAEGVEPQIARLQNMPLAIFPTTVEAHRRGEPVYVDVLSMPPGPRRNFMAAQETQSGLAIPLMFENTCVGSVGFDWVKKPYIYSDDQARLLVFFAYMLASIRQRQRMEGEMRANEQRFRALIEHSQDGIVLLAADGTVLYDSPSYSRIMGHTPKERLGRYAFEFVCPEDRCKVEQSFIELVSQKGAVTSHEARFMHKDGTPRAVEMVRTNLLHDPAVRAVVVNFRDITNRKHAAEMLRRNESELQAILESTADGILAVDTEGRVIKANHRFVEFWRIPPTLLESHDDQALLTFVLDQVPDPEGFLSKVQALYKSDAVDMDTIRFKDERVFERYSNPMMMEGSRIGRVWSFRDITARKRAEEEKEKLQGQLIQAQKMESVGRLAGGVAHDFNNMLMVILGNAEMCKDRIEPAHPIYPWLEEIITGGERAQSLTSQLLAFARRQPIAPQVLDLNVTISSMLNWMQRLIGEDIVINWRPDAVIGPVAVDPSQIDQILTNLMVNARDAINGVGSITLSTSNTTLDSFYCDTHLGANPGNYVLLSFSDTGSGMNRETLAHIFEPFFTTKRIGKGTGLGLATVYGIVKQNNGFIDVYSEPGQGTQFKIYWPHALDQNAHPAMENISAAAIGGSETILLVEDEESVRTVAHRFLSSLGYTVLAAEDSSKALRLVEQHPDEIHLLLTDVILPDTNGRDLFLRLVKIRPAIKCLFISGFTADVLTQRGILADGVNFLPKPFTRDKLARKIRETLTA